MMLSLVKSIGTFNHFINPFLIDRYLLIETYLEIVICYHTRISYAFVYDMDWIDNLNQ